MKKIRKTKLIMLVTSQKRDRVQVIRFHEGYCQTLELSFVCFVLEGGLGGRIRKHLLYF